MTILSRQADKPIMFHADVEKIELSLHDLERFMIQMSMRGREPRIGGKSGKIITGRRTGYAPDSST